MKKLISLILVVLLFCMALPAMAEEDITGDWYLKTMKMGDQEYDAAAIGFAITMTLNADGTSSMSMPDSEEALVGTWALDGDKITVTINDEPVSGIVTDGAITLSQDGQDMIFTREAVEGITLAETKAAESAEEFYGDWTCLYVETEGTLIDISVIGMGVPSVTISETGLEFFDEEDGALTLILKVNKLDAPVFAEGKLSVKAAADAANPDFTIDAELLEDGMLKMTLVASDSPMNLYFVPAEPAATGEGWLYEGSSFSIKTADLPQGYTCLPYEQFKAGYKALVDGTLTQASTYEDVANAFGAEGIQMVGIQYEGYAYYSWYSDKDYTPSTRIHVLVTFKVKDGNLTYYAYSSEGITFMDVK